jgi:hypothetical protein
MSAYDPPSEITPIFNPSFWIAGTDSLTKSEADALYLSIFGGQTVPQTESFAQGIQTNTIKPYGTSSQTLTFQTTGQSNFSGSVNVPTGSTYKVNNVNLIASQTGQSGKYLSTNGTSTSWATVDTLPSQTGNSGKYLGTNGTIASWSTVDTLPTQTGNNGKYLSTNGTIASWASVPDTLPPQVGNAGKYLSTNGTAPSWSTVDSTPTSASTNLIQSGGVYTALQSKANTFTTDATPTASSTNPVQSGGVYTALQSKANTFTTDATPTSASTNPVQSGGVYTALQSKANTFTTDATPTSASTNPVQSGGVYTALQSKANTFTTDATPTASSTNPVQSGGVYTAIQGISQVPSQSGQSGKYLSTNGTIASWQTVPATTPSGSNTQVQFNDSGSFGGSSGLAFNKATNLLTTGQLLVNSSLTSDTPSTAGIYQGLVSTGNYRLKFVNPTTTSADAPSIDFGTTSTAYSGRMEYNHNQNAFKFYNNGSQTAMIDGFGEMSVGGSTSPASTLDILTGDLRIRSGRVLLNSTFSTLGIQSSNALIRVDPSTSNVGIAQAPSYKLDVAGDCNITTGSVFRINGSSVLSSTALGSSVVSSSLTSVGTLSSLTVSSSITGNTLILNNIPNTTTSNILYYNTTTKAVSYGTAPATVPITATSTDATYYPAFMSTTSGNLSAVNVDTDLTYNPSTNLLTTVGLRTTTGTCDLAYRNSGRRVEVNSDVTNASFIDFHSYDNSTSDYDTRIVSTGGNTTTSGQGTLSYNALRHNFGASDVTFGSSSTNPSLNMIDSNGDMKKFYDGSWFKFPAINNRPCIGVIRGTITSPTASTYYDQPLSGNYNQNGTLLTSIVGGNANWAFATGVNTPYLNQAPTLTVTGTIPAIQSFWANNQSYIRFNNVSGYSNWRFTIWLLGMDGDLFN